MWCLTTLKKLNDQRAETLRALQKKKEEVEKSLETLRKKGSSSS